MHARLLHMWSNDLKEDGHQYKIDNLFNSVKLSLTAYCLPKKVLVHGVLRKGGRGCPPCVYQEPMQGKRADAVRGTVKAAVLKGDKESSDLVVAS